MSSLAFENDLPAVLTQVDTLPSLPSVAVEVLRLTQAEDSSIDDMARVIANDPAMTAKMLKLANSSLFSMGQSITTLERATMVLGLKTVKLMALSFSLAEAIPVEGGRFRHDDFWHRSLVSATAARSLSQLFGMRNADEAFLCGLLTHFGKLVLAQVLSEDYDDVVSGSGGWPSEEVETASLGFSSRDLCAMLLKSWDLPALIYMSVGYATRVDQLPDDAEQNTRDLAFVLGAARHVEQVLCDTDKAESLEELHAIGHERLNAAEDEIEDYLVNLERDVSRAADLLEIRLPSGMSHEDILNQARLQMVDVGLGTAVDLREERLRNQALESERHLLENKAATDSLTGLPNRASFDGAVAHHVNARMQSQPQKALGLILIDVDKFKAVNDTYGHTVGDEVLRTVARALLGATRKTDLLARYGGEEFALVVPQCNPTTLCTVAERLRVAIESTVIDCGEVTLQVTASFGGACIEEFDSREQIERFIAVADECLYQAKENGRNQTVIRDGMSFDHRRAA